MTVYCPFCKTTKPMKKSGHAFNGKGEKCVRYQCTNKMCARYTIKPLKSK